ncbi:dead end protein 1 [Chaetodon auriga]|uniref:dead end protein 1 n=1 Tax=Chaetodon auriga TaxID=39042 RepID=UPI0040329E78
MMERQQIQMLNVERVRELETWLKTTNIKLTQVNGQRKYGGPPEVWDGPTPGARCEVFISQIPRDAYEDLLIPLFSSVGPLWEFRLMMNFSGQNRGFAYAKYGSPAVATSAIRLLHGHMLEPGLRLTVRHSTEKRHVCIGGLPATTRQEDLLQVLRTLIEGVERVSLKSGPGIEGVSATVVFSSHHAAAMAKKVLVEAFNKKFELAVSVKWQTSVKPGPDKPQLPQKLAMKPLHHIVNSPQPPVPPPHLLRPPSIPPGFCKAVGGPTAMQHLPPPYCSTATSSSQGHLMSAASSASPVMLLRKLCEATGFGRPLYEMHCRDTGYDGFLHFNYKVCIPGISMAFEGAVMILPGPTASTTLEEAQRAVAQQILQRVSSNQLLH